MVEKDNCMHELTKIDYDHDCCSGKRQEYCVSGAGKTGEPSSGDQRNCIHRIRFIASKCGIKPPCVEGTCCLYPSVLESANLVHGMTYGAYFFHHLRVVMSSASLLPLFLFVCNKVISLPVSTPAEAEQQGNK